jgi:tricarballylate dehydrogenase
VSESDVSVERWDVVVVGAGNAGLTAAISARASGARVLLLEKAPEGERGGNTAFTGGLLRFPFRSSDEVQALLRDATEAEFAAIDLGRYTEEDYADDLDRVSEGLADPVLVRTLTRRAYETMRWLGENGVRWVLATGRQSYQVDGKMKFFGNLVLEASGGGRGLSDGLFGRALALGVEIRYRTAATALTTRSDGGVVGVEVRTPAGHATLLCNAVVLASGGFQANVEMRAQYLGPEWDLAKVRGSRFDTGDGIRMALEKGAQPFGHWSSCHAVAWDAMASDTGDRSLGDIPQRHSYPIGLIVNRSGQRFVDEGADFRNYTYAKYGREILRQPGRIAFQIYDQKTIPLLREEYRVRPVTKVRANTIEELADQMLIDPVGLRRTIDDFNAAVTDTPFNPSVLDGRAAHPPGQPSKTNWAVAIDEPPFEAFAVTCGITFTFGGVRVDDQARVLDRDNRPIPGLYAAGELVGGLFYYNYPGGSGLMAGAVFGRTAGLNAADQAAKESSPVGSAALGNGA